MKLVADQKKPKKNSVRFETMDINNQSGTRQVKRHETLGDNVVQNYPKITLCPHLVSAILYKLQRKKSVWLRQLQVVVVFF